MVECNKMNKVFIDAIRYCEFLYTRELRKYLAARDCDRQLKTSGVNSYMVWGFMDEYCFVQGMLNAKLMWNHDIFEDKCFQCPMAQWCRFRKLVK